VSAPVVPTPGHTTAPSHHPSHHPSHAASPTPAPTSTPSPVAPPTAAPLLVDVLGWTGLTPLRIDLAAQVSGATGPVTFTVTQPAHGHVTLLGGIAVYTRHPGAEGTDWFTYTVNDTHGGSAVSVVGVPAPGDDQG
jgi:hypothetical protein